MTTRTKQRTKTQESVSTRKATVVSAKDDLGETGAVNLGASKDAKKERPARVKAGTKWCPAHGKAHPVAEFGKDKNTKDGLYRICKVADREQQRAWREAKKQKEAK